MTALRVLVVTSEWPSEQHPHGAPFLVQNVNHMRAAGAEVEVFPFRGSKSPLNYLKAWLRLRRTHRLRDFDIVHCHFGQSGVVAWPCPVPLVITFHGSDLQGVVGADGRYTRASGVLRKLSRFAARKATENIVVSRRLLAFLPPLRRPAHVIALGVDVERFGVVRRDEARKRLSLPQDARLILFAASPTNGVKRFELAQAAVEEFRRTETARGETAEIQLVTLSGQSHEVVPLYMNACDALLLTSRHEGSPTVVKEALMCNLPIVSVDVGDVRERLENLEGCTVCEATPAALAEGLRNATVPQRRLDARSKLAELDERQVVQRIFAVYQAAMATRRA